jgi:hypothetical protein
VDNQRHVEEDNLLRGKRKFSCFSRFCGGETGRKRQWGSAHCPCSSTQKLEDRQERALRNLLKTLCCLAGSILKTEDAQSVRWLGELGMGCLGRIHHLLLSDLVTLLIPDFCAVNCVVFSRRVCLALAESDVAMLQFVRCKTRRPPEGPATAGFQEGHEMEWGFRR